MIKFVWGLGHHGSGRFEATDHPDEWRCMDCDAVMEKTKPDTVTEDGWRLLGEVTDDS